MAEVKILITPDHIKAAASKAAELIKKLDYEVLFLNFSRNLENGIKELAEGAPYDYVLDRLRELKLIPEPTGSWEYGAEPILRALRGIQLKKPGLKIHCYKDPDLTSLSEQLAEKTALLIFRWCSTGKMELEEWKALLASWLDLETEALDREADLLIKKAEVGDKNVCIAGFNGRHIKAHLKEAGYHVRLQCLYVPYHFTPLEILAREIRLAPSKGSTLPSQRIEELMEQHARFIRDYVTVSENYDDAHRHWMWDRAPWLRHRMTLKPSLP
ncbi:MAG: hypothetical protein QW231_05440 [Candidatus Bathyarchaeia archaeon]